MYVREDALLFLLNYVAKHGDSIESPRATELRDRMLADVPKMCSTPEIRMECPEEIKFEVVKELTEYFESGGYDVVDVDGARVTFEDGWGLVRASNTQPVLVLRFEAASEKRRDAIRSLIEGRLDEVPKKNKP